MTMRRYAAVLIALLPFSSASAADAAAGKAYFKAQCSLCHTAEPGDNGGAQGPDLLGLYGRAAASNGTYTYSAALRDSKLSWDAPTLARFLAAPTDVVPGTSMVVPVPVAKDRDDLIAYFASVKDLKADVGHDTRAPKGAADWKLDKPGRVHRVDTNRLSAPFATQSARNHSRLVARPADARLALPKGFKAAVYTTALEGPRLLVTAPNGDIFAAETKAGRIRALRPASDGSKPERIETFAQSLELPFGMAFYPSGSDPQWLYVAEVNRVLRFAYRSGELVAGAKPEVVIDRLSATTGGHTTRAIAFSADGKRLFVSVGSLSNVADDLEPRSPAEIREWETKYGLGAAWGKEENRAAVLVYELGSKAPPRHYANGIRNCVGLSLQPATGDLWCTTNERDALGDDLVPDYSTRVKEGGFYGWPWYYLGNHQDPRHPDARPDLAGKAIVPDVLMAAHSAALNLSFYPANRGASAFPKEYAGDAFVVMRGSWNRAARTGHKIVRLRMKNNEPTGTYEDFMTGFIVDDNSAWARPTSTTVAADGSLLMSEDGNNVVYRISYSRKR